MNKTQKRAQQKHRAKALKYEARRKSGYAGTSGAAAGDMGRSRSAASAPRGRSSARTEATETAPEETVTVAAESE